MRPQRGASFGAWRMRTVDGGEPDDESELRFVARRPVQRFDGNMKTGPRRTRGPAVIPVSSVTNRRPGRDHRLRQRMSDLPAVTAMPGWGYSVTRWAQMAPGEVPVEVPVALPLELAAAEEPA
jgi:hypothetical protein